LSNINKCDWLAKVSTPTGLVKKLCDYNYNSGITAPELCNLGCNSPLFLTNQIAWIVYDFKMKKMYNNCINKVILAGLT
jgi:hypothetical protein